MCVNQTIWYCILIQIKDHVAKYMKQLESVLGKECWESHMEGRRLKQDTDAFNLKLTTLTNQIFDNWKSEVSVSIAKDSCKHATTFDQSSEIVNVWNHIWNL